MDIAAVLLNFTDPFEQIVNILSTEGPMWNLVKIVQAVSDKTFKDFTSLYMYIAQGQWLNIFPKQMYGGAYMTLSK